MSASQLWRECSQRRFLTGLPITFAGFLPTDCRRTAVALALYFLLTYDIWYSALCSSSVFVQGTGVQKETAPPLVHAHVGRTWGTVTHLKPQATILHSRKDDVIHIADLEELVPNSGLPPETLIEVGDDHRLTDEEPLKAMVDACVRLGIKS